MSVKASLATGPMWLNITIQKRFCYCQRQNIGSIKASLLLIPFMHVIPRPTHSSFVIIGQLSSLVLETRRLWLFALF